MTVKSSKTPNINDIERYNQNKNNKIIAEEYMDIDAQIQIIDAREDLDLDEKNQMKKGLLDEIDQYIHQLGSVSGNQKSSQGEMEY
jgi:hypothetical protein